MGDPSEAHDENFADSGQVAAEQGESMVLANKLREQLDDVQRGELDKLDAGTYGICDACGAAIGEARAEAMPATRFLHRSRRLTPRHGRSGTPEPPLLRVAPTRVVGGGPASGSPSNCCPPRPSPGRA